MKQHQGLGALFVAGGVLLATQPVWAAATQVTGVRLNPSNGGVQVLLETQEGDRPQIFMINRRNELVTDITNTQLRIPGNSFRQNNPAPGIAAVTIEQANANSVRVTVSGVSNPPKGEIVNRPGGGGIGFSFSPTGGTAATPLQGNNQTAQVPAAAPTVQNAQINGQPAPPAGTIQPINPAPPFLPRAVAPPTGDIAVSEVDSSGNNIDLGTGDRIPRLLLREAPVREVLSLLSRAAGLNIVFIAPQTAGVPGQPGQAPPGAPGQPGAANPSLDATISLDIENEPLQDVFNYVLRITGLEANRNGRTIFVGNRLPDVARNLIVRTLRLNQVNATQAANFLVAQGAELQQPIVRETLVTLGTGTNAQNSIVREPDIKLIRAQQGEGSLVLRGLSVLVPPDAARVNSITLVGDPRKVEVASNLLAQLDSRRRQVAVNVKIIDVNLLNTDTANASFSFGIGRSFFTFDQGAASFNFGGVNPPTIGDVNNSVINPPIIPSSPRVIPGTTVGPFLDAQPNAPFGTGSPQSFGDPPLNDGSIQFPPRGIFVRPPFGANDNPLQGGVTQNQGGNIQFGLPQLFQFPSRFLSVLQAQIVTGNAKILTDPTLVIQEGEIATVNLGTEVVTNILAEREVTNGVPVVTRTAQKDIAGLQLQVEVNRIDDNGFVTLRVNPRVTVPGATATIDDQTITLLSRRDLISGQLRLRDGQTLILSGIIQDQDRSDVRKVPILGDIPILGALFRRTTRQNSRQEVIVLLTPQILDDSSDSQFGYRYRPSPEVQQMLQQRGGVPGSLNQR